MKSEMDSDVSCKLCFRIIFTNYTSPRCIYMYLYTHKNMYFTLHLCVCLHCRQLCTNDNNLIE